MVMTIKSASHFLFQMILERKQRLPPPFTGSSQICWPCLVLMNFASLCRSGLQNTYYCFYTRRRRRRGACISLRLHRNQFPKLGVVRRTHLIPRIPAVVYSRRQHGNNEPIDGENEQRSKRQSSSFHRRQKTVHRSRTSSPSHTKTLCASPYDYRRRSCARPIIRKQVVAERGPRIFFGSFFFFF